MKIEDTDTEPPPHHHHPSDAHIGQLQSVSKSTCKETMGGAECDCFISLHITMRLWRSLICLVESRSVWIQIEGCLIVLILSPNLSYTQSVSWFTTAQKEHILAPCQHCCDLYKNTFPTENPLWICERCAQGSQSIELKPYYFLSKNMVQNNPQIIHNWICGSSRCFYLRQWPRGADVELGWLMGVGGL